MQLYVVHVVRAALKYVLAKDSDEVIADLKKIDLPSGDGRRSRRGPRQICSSVG